MSETAVVPFEGQQHDLAIYRPPKVVLEEAQKAAKALKEVLDNKPRKVMFNNEQYLEFEDWQTVGRFYGVTAKVVSSTLIDVDGIKGFEAKAEAVRADGVVVSCADAMCLKDERNWKDKPLFQLRSMAQTRACSKALRNVLSWVVVLAGYKPTPAEEMEGGVYEHKPSPPETPQEPAHAPLGAYDDESEDTIRAEMDITLDAIAEATNRKREEILKKCTWGKDGRYAVGNPSELKYQAVTKQGKPWSPLKAALAKVKQELELVQTDLPLDG